MAIYQLRVENRERGPFPESGKTLEVLSTSHSPLVQWIDKIAFEPVDLVAPSGS